VLRGVGPVPVAECCRQRPFLGVDPDQQERERGRHGSHTEPVRGCQADPPLASRIPVWLGWRSTRYGPLAITGWPALTITVWVK
jgi:hypothetical protein